MEECSLLQTHLQLNHVGNVSSHGLELRARAHLHAQWLQLPTCIRDFTFDLNLSTTFTVFGSALMWLFLWFASAPKAEDSLEDAPSGAVAGSVDSPRIADWSATPRIPRRKTNILALDGLRLPLILLIAYGHLLEYLNGMGMSIPENMMNFFAQPFWEMQFFFVLSGFAFGYSSDDGRFEKPGSWSVFMARRLARLLPAYQIANFWCMAVRPCLSSDDSACLVSYPLTSVFMQSWFPVTFCSSGPIISPLVGNFPAWFVSNIMTMSAVSPWLSRNLPRFSNWYLMLLLLVGVIVLRSVVTVFYYSFWPLGPADLFVFYFWVPFRMPEYCAGILTARLYDQMPEHICQWPGWGWIFDWCLVSAIVAAVLVCPVAWSFAGDCFLTGPFCLLCLAAACAVWQADDGKPTSGLLGRVLASWPLNAGAHYSHAVYHINTPVRYSIPMLWWSLQYWWLEVPSFFVASVVTGVAVTALEDKLALAVQARLSGKAGDQQRKSDT